MSRKKIKPVEKKYILSKYIIGTTSDDKKEWKRIMINGKQTNYEANKEGVVRDRDTKEIKNPYKNKYYQYNIKIEDGGMAVSIMRHRLMMALFVPIPSSYREKGYQQENLQVNHVDGIKGHDTLENLEWCTVKENMDHAIRTGLVKYLGENSYMATISDEDAIEICELLASGKRPKEVSKITGIREKVVRHIYDSESWKQLSKDYTFPEYDGPKPYMYSDEVISIICDLIQEGNLNNREISEITGVSEGYISDIKNKKRRTEISTNYDFSEVPQRNPGKAKQAKEICELIQAGEMTLNEIADKFDVSYELVNGIKNGYTWSDISKDYDFSKWNRESNSVSIETVHEICQMIQDNKLNDISIAKKVGVDRKYVNMIKHGEVYSDISKDYDFSNIVNNPEMAVKAREICELLQEGELSVTEISKKVGLGISSVYSIKNRRTWTNISKNYDFSKFKCKTIPDEKIHEICRLIEKGDVLQKDICTQVGVSAETVRDIRNRKRRPDISKDYKF